LKIISICFYERQVRLAVPLFDRAEKQARNCFTTHRNGIEAASIDAIKLTIQDPKINE
jgi:hypothetical protein